MLNELPGEGEVAVAQSGHVRLRDLRDIYRLVGECRDYGHDPVVWRAHMLDGLTRLTGAPVGIGGEVWVDAATGAVAADLPPVEVGWAGPRAHQRFLAYLRDSGPTGDPKLREVLQLQRPLVTRSRDQPFDDRAWCRSAKVNGYHRVSALEQVIQSYYRLPDGRINVICLMRAPGDRAFSARERRMLHLFHHELGPMIGPVLVREPVNEMPGLSPRLRQTLDCLLNGDSEKRTAERLGVSRATAHQYITALYRHFDVHSRAELLAEWIDRPYRPAAGLNTTVRHSARPCRGRPGRPGPRRPESREPGSRT